MSARDVLIAARALIATPDRWTQGTYYRDASGAVCPSSKAFCYCIMGAFHSVPRDAHEEYRNGVELLTTAVNLKNEGDIEDWNDVPERTHAEVMAAFDRAIELAGEAE